MKMKLIVDAMGGDHAPEQIVRGAFLGMKKDEDIELIFTGDEKAIRAAMEKYDIPEKGIEIVHTPVKIEMEEDPLCILKSKKDSSMAMGDGEEVVKSIFLLVIFCPDVLLMYSQTFLSHGPCLIFTSPSC